MRRRVLLPLGVAAVIALTACGSDGSPEATPSTDTAQPSSVTYEPAGPNPSASAKMVCADEARKDIAAALGMREQGLTAPTWTDHLYECGYVYEKGSFRLQVKELVSEEATTDYYNGLAEKLGKAQKLIGLGQGAFVTKKGDVVVRKDYKVLRVNVQNLPDGLGGFVPAMTRSDVATNIAVVIMGCWVGA